MIMTISSYELNYFYNGLNLTAKTAYEGKKEEVDQLISDGGALADAAYGYAWGEHHTLVKNILDAHPELIEYAVTGYARAGNKEKIAEFSKQEALKHALVYGFALAGDETQIRAALNARNGTKYLPDIIKGLASANHMELLLNLAMSTKFYPIALRAAAKSGHVSLVKALLDQLSIDFDKLSKPLEIEIKTALGYVLQGYSEGRHFLEAAELLNLGVNPMFCLNSLENGQGKLDATDASYLLSAIKNPKLQDSMKELMESQCGLNLETLNSELTFKTIEPYWQHTAFNHHQ